MTTPAHEFAEVLAHMKVAEAVCYSPCAGRDVGLVLNWLGSSFNRFVFCDIAYSRSAQTGRGVVPDGWHELSSTDMSGRPLRGRSAETWQRPDGTSVALEFLAHPAEECLTRSFGKGTISALVHINDGEGEGGSNLWFLGTARGCSGTIDRCLLDIVSERLAKKALVITDGALADREFSRLAQFNRCGRTWQPLTQLENTRVKDRKVVAWHSTLVQWQY